MPYKLPEDMIVLITVGESAPLGYMNVFEAGDLWIKTQGCDKCKPERRVKCCGTCGMVSEKGCWLQIGERGQKKPLFCVIQPTPDQGLEGCALEFECKRGSMKGKVRRLNESLEDLNK